MVARIRSRALAVLAALLCTLFLITPSQAGADAPAFSVLAFYNGTYDAAHIAYVHEANRIFPQLAAKYHFSYEATNDWDRLDSISPDQYQVVMFLDDLPADAAQRNGFQHYMESGGGFFGFHVSAFNTDPSTWDWYHNQFLGTGAFVSNTWEPTTAVLKVEATDHPATRRLPSAFVSGVSEWYSWADDLRQNPNIKILASVDPSSFPLGTDPNQSWYSGYYPILWTNKNYKMLYANFGHDAMNYDANVPLSSTFADPVQDEFIVDGLLWLGGAAASDAPTDPIDPNSWFSVVNAASGSCASAAATVNGTGLTQADCDDGAGQQFRFATTSGPWLQIDAEADPSAALDVTGQSTSDGAGVQLWSYSGGDNQQWQAVPDANDTWHVVNKHSAKCLTAPSGTGGQFTQSTCVGAASQEFTLHQES